MSKYSAALNTSAMEASGGVPAASTVRSLSRRVASGVSAARTYPVWASSLGSSGRTNARRSSFQNVQYSTVTGARDAAGPACSAGPPPAGAQAARAAPAAAPGPSTPAPAAPRRRRVQAPPGPLAAPGPALRARCALAVPRPDRPAVARMAMLPARRAGAR